MPPSKPPPTPSPSPSIHPLVLATESRIAPYPRHFPSISSVKSHIARLAALDLSNLTADKVCYTVALRAYQAGEFYLDVEPKYNRREKGGGALRSMS